MIRDEPNCQIFKYIFISFVESQKLPDWIRLMANSSNLSSAPANTTCSTRSFRGKKKILRSRRHRTMLIVRKKSSKAMKGKPLRYLSFQNMSSRGPLGTQALPTRLRCIVQKWIHTTWLLVTLYMWSDGNRGVVRNYFQVTGYISL